MVGHKWISGVKNNLGNHRDFENYRDLLLVLVQKEITVRYKNKLLGYLWSIANPLSSAFVYFVAFKLVMRVNIENYTLVLIAGLFPWQWFSNSISSSPNMFVSNASIIKKVNFPRNIIPLSIILNHMIHFVISIPVLLGFVLGFRQLPTLAWLYGIPILLGIQLLTVYGVALALASLNLFLRDLERLTGIVMHFLFFFTPILYEIDMIPESHRYLLAFNPAAPLIISWKQLFLYGSLEWTYVGISLIYSMIAFLVGYSIYRKLSWKFAEVI